VRQACRVARVRHLWGDGSIPVAGQAGFGATDRDNAIMLQALAEAKRAAEEGEVPVGALFVDNDVVIARAGNRRETDVDPTAHAEIVVLRWAAKRLDRRRLGGTLYVTLEPCAMCAGALILARVDRLVFGAADPKAGACGSCVDVVRAPYANHRIEVVGGLLAEASTWLLQGFFKQRRTPHPSGNACSTGLRC